VAKIIDITEAKRPRKRATRAALSGVFDGAADTIRGYLDEFAAAMGRMREQRAILEGMLAGDAYTQMLDAENTQIATDALARIHATEGQVAWIENALGAYRDWLANPGADTAPTFTVPEGTPSYSWDVEYGAGLQGLTGLAAAPLIAGAIPLAGLIGAIALLTATVSYVAEKMGILDSRMRRYRDLTAAGVADAEAWRRANEAEPDSPLGQISGVLKLALVALGVWIVAPMLRDAMGGKRRALR